MKPTDEDLNREAIDALLKSIDSKPKPRRPKRLAQAVSALMAQRGYAGTQTADALQRAWRQAAGPLAALSQATRVRGGVLEIVASNSIAVQELTFQKQALLTCIQQLAPEARIRDLKVRQGVL